MIHQCRALLAATALLGLATAVPRSGTAATASGTVAVTATSLSACTIAATPLAFGTYGQTLLTTFATLTILCTSTSAYTIGLDSGTTSGASQSARLLYNASAGSSLAYALYSDSGRTLPWTSNTLSGVGSGLVQTVNVYGAIAAGLQSAPGAYTDLVTATLSY